MAQPTVSKHWRQLLMSVSHIIFDMTWLLVWQIWSYLTLKSPSNADWLMTGKASLIQLIECYAGKDIQTDKQCNAHGQWYKPTTWKCTKTPKCKKLVCKMHTRGSIRNKVTVTHVWTDQKSPSFFEVLDNSRHVFNNSSLWYPLNVHALLDKSGIHT